MATVKKVCALLLLLSAVNAQNTTRCYVCNEDDPVCNDPVNIASLPSSECADLFFPAGRSAADPVNNTLAHRVQSIIRNDVISRSSESSYECIKVAATLPSGSNGVFRSCVVQTPRIEDICKFLLEELTNYTFNSCDRCEGNNCNTATGLPIFAASILSIFLVCSLLLN